MTNDEILRAILDWYFISFVQGDNGNPLYQNLIFERVVRVIQPGIESGQVELLRNQVLEDGMLAAKGYGEPEPYYITQKGIEICQIRYNKLVEDTERIEQQTKIEQLKSLRRTKWNLWVSIIAIIISIGALVPSIINLFEGNSLNKEVLLLRHEVDSLKSINPILK